MLIEKDYHIEPKIWSFSPQYPWVHYSHHDNAEPVHCLHQKRLEGKILGSCDKTSQILGKDIAEGIRSWHEKLSYLLHLQPRWLKLLVWNRIERKCAWKWWWIRIRLCGQVDWEHVLVWVTMVFDEPTEYYLYMVLKLTIISATYCMLPSSSCSCYSWFIYRSFQVACQTVKAASAKSTYVKMPTNQICVCGWHQNIW